MSEEFTQEMKEAYKKAIVDVFKEIQNCNKLHDAIDTEEPSSTRQYMKETLVKRQGELERRLEELTGLTIYDFDFHVE